MSISLFSDEYFMKMALKEAKQALAINEVPIGAIVVCNKSIVAKAHNQVEKLNDATAHAEMLAITAAMDAFGSKYLKDCILYATIEPCFMCAGAINLAQLKKIVFGAADPKKGFQNFSKKILHRKTKLVTGVLEEACSALLVDFFSGKRN